MNRLKHERINVASNNFNITPDAISELKNMFKKAVTDHFLGYCSVKGLISKVESQIHFEKYMKMLVRPKSHYEPAITIKDTLQYMKKKAPYYIDLDEFLLYFTLHPYAYYAVE